MRLSCLIIAFCMLVGTGVKVSGQSDFGSFNEAPIQLFPSLPLHLSESINSDVVLSQGLPLLQRDFQSDDFKLTSEQESPEGFFYYFECLQEGIPYLDRYVKFFVDRNYVLRQAIFQTNQVAMPKSGSFADFDELKSTLLGFSYVGETKQVWLWQAPVWKAAIEVMLVEDIGAFAEKRYYGGDFKELERRDFAWRKGGKDTTVLGLVFNPDPLTSAQVAYGGSYQDFNDGDTSTLNNERISKPLRITFRNDSFILADSVFHFAEIESPVSNEPKGLTAQFNFTRGQDEFEYVNSFYHLQTWIRRVHDLGYNLPKTTVQIDPHASNGSDNSAFTPVYGELALLYGDGGIDDAEDADVLVHESGHLLSYAAAPGTAYGLARRSIDEGNGDYFAMSYSRQISNYGWQKTYNWDGNVTWKGRVVNSPKVFPGDYSNNEHFNGEVWATALAEVYDSIGPDKTDRMVLCALYFQVSNMEFVQMVNSCRLCDSIQNGGANSSIIFNAMNRGGMAYPLGFKNQRSANWRLLNSAGFAFRGESMSVDFAGAKLSGKMELYDMQGKLIRSESFQGTQALDIKAEDIKKGLYLLRVTSDTNLSYSFLVARH